MSAFSRVGSTVPEDENYPVLSARGIAKTFQVGGGDIVALQGVDLDIRRGEFISFVGPSGCGKSTFLNMVAGLLPATSGTASVMGEAVEGPSPRVGFMFQSPVLLPWRSVLKNVLMPAEVHGLDPNTIEAKARSVITAVGLGGFEDAYPRQLSGGMQQRVALARVLTYEPELLLMDEPFGALDEFTREAMNLELMRITQAAGITVLFVTHNIAEAVFMADRVVVMTPRPGKVSGIIEVDLGRPRSIDTMREPRFSDLTFNVRGILGGGHGHA